MNTENLTKATHTAAFLVEELHAALDNANESNELFAWDRLQALMSEAVELRAKIERALYCAKTESKETEPRMTDEHIETVADAMNELINEQAASAAYRILKDNQHKISETFPGWGFWQEEQVGSFFFEKDYVYIYATPYWEEQKGVAVTILDEQGAEMLGPELQNIAPNLIPIEYKGNDEQFLADYLEIIAEVIGKLAAIA